MSFKDNSLNAMFAMLHSEWSMGNLIPANDVTKAKLEKAQRMIDNNNLNTHSHAENATRPWKRNEQRNYCHY